MCEHVRCNHRQWMLMLDRLELCKWADWSIIVGCLTDINNFFHRFTPFWWYTLLVENVHKSFRYLYWVSCYSRVSYAAARETWSTDWKTAPGCWIVDTLVRRQRITETVCDLGIWVIRPHIFLNIVPNIDVINWRLLLLDVVLNLVFYTLPLDDSKTIRWKSLGLESTRLLQFDGAVAWGRLASGRRSQR